MTNAEKKAAHKCNIKDFIQKFSDPKYKKNNRKQLDEVVDYLARYGMNGSKAECSFDELLITAQNLLLSQAAEQHLDEFNTNPYSNLGNVNIQEEYELRKFILYPISTIKERFHDYDPYRQLKGETDPDKIKYYKDLQANAHRISNLMKDENYEVNEAEKANSYIEVMTRIQKRLPETTKSVDQALDNNRGGVFERMFSSTSKQYSNFKAAFKDFRNPNSVYLGDKNHLERETKAYLHHVMPSYKITDDLPTPEQFAALSGTQKGRAAFCINVLRSIKETREIEPLKDNVTKALKGELKEEQIIIEGEQEELHSKINDDLNKNAVKANAVMEKANDKVKEKNLDDSSDDLSELYDELTK